MESHENSISSLLAKTVEESRPNRHVHRNAPPPMVTTLPSQYVRNSNRLLEAIISDQVGGECLIRLRSGESVVRNAPSDLLEKAKELGVNNDNLLALNCGVLNTWDLIDPSDGHVMYSTKILVA